MNEDDTFWHGRNLEFAAKELACADVIDNIICDFYDIKILSERSMRTLLEEESTCQRKARRIVSFLSALKKTQGLNRKIAGVFYKNGLCSLAEIIDSQYVSNLNTRDTNCNLDGDLQTLPNIHSSASLPMLSVIPDELPPSPDSTVSLDEDRLNNSTYDNLQIIVTPSKKIYGGENHAEIYKNESRPRGYVFLSNTSEFAEHVYKERVGSSTDVENLRNLFSQMGYVVEEHTNLGKGALKKELRNFSEDQEKLSKVDSCIIVIMSHGSSEKKIVTADNLTIKDDEIIDYFTNPSCPALCGKPKIFIFQFCRGSQIDIGAEPIPFMKQVSNRIGHTRVPNSTDGVSFGETIHINRIPSCTDIFCVYSAIEGHVAYLNEERGSWLVQSICVEFMNHAHNTDFETLLKMVSRRISRDFTSHDGRKQQIERSVRGFDKHFYFNPQPLWSMDLTNVDASSLHNLQDLSNALNEDMSSSMNGNLSSTPPHELRARAWEAESRSSTPDLLRPYDLQNSGSGVWLRSRHGSGASLGSRDTGSPYSPAMTPFSSQRPKEDERRFSFGSALSENQRGGAVFTCSPCHYEEFIDRWKMSVLQRRQIFPIPCGGRDPLSRRVLMKGNLGGWKVKLKLNVEACNEGLVNSTFDEVDQPPSSITGTAKDYRKWRLHLAFQNGDDKRPSSLKRQLSAPTDQEALTKITSLEHFLQINDMDEHVPALFPIKEALFQKKMKAKKKKREFNTSEF